MKRLSFIMSIVFGAGFVSLCPAPASAQFQVIIAPGTAGATTIMDNGPGDMDPAPNVIDFALEPGLGGGNKGIFSGLAKETITAKGMNGGFGQLTLSHTGAG